MPEGPLRLLNAESLKRLSRLFEVAWFTLLEDMEPVTPESPLAEDIDPFSLA
jgi:hypothetical protein